MESAFTISPPSCCAICIATAVLPVAVGPTSTSGTRRSGPTCGTSSGLLCCSSCGCWHSILRSVPFVNVVSSECFARFQRMNLQAVDVLCLLAQRLRSACQSGKRGIVDRDDVTNLKQPNRVCCLHRPHGKEIADG